MRRIVFITALAAAFGAAEAAPAAKAPAAKAKAQPTSAPQAQPAENDEPGFLFDALRGYHYHIAWDKLLNSVKNPGPVPDWLTNFDREREGAAGEMKPITIEGKPYKISYVCKPENCAGHRFVVLFDAGGVHAYGALGGKDEPPEFYGAPNPAEQEAMTAMMHPTPRAQAPAETPKSQ
jgi:hypothetical protein